MSDTRAALRVAIIAGCAVAPAAGVRAQVLQEAPMPGVIRDATRAEYPVGTSFKQLVDPKPWPERLVTTNIGAATSQADFPPIFPTPGGLAAAAARSRFSVDGSGVRIGIISDAFNSLGGQSAGVFSGDLPGPGNPFGNTLPVVNLNDLPAGQGIDEGRGMAELIHDLAPGAELYFHSGFTGSIGFAYQQLANAGCDIIVDDLSALTGASFLDDNDAITCTNLANQGLLLFSSAGNRGRNSYEGVFNDSGETNPMFPFSSPLHDFKLDAGVDTGLNVAVNPGGSVIAVLEWDDPFPSVGAPASATLADFDLAVFTTGGTLVDSSTVGQGSPNGADPVEIVSFANTGAAQQQFLIQIQNFSGGAGRLLKLTFFRSFINADDDFTFSPTVRGQHLASGVFAVGAVAYDSTTVEGFSSRGPSTILFDQSGNRLPGPEVRAKPEIAATDGTDTTFFGGGDFDGTGFPNFFGTSAAAPHAAAVAALAVEFTRRELGTTPDFAELNAAFQATSDDSFGTVDEVGVGLINAELLIESFAAGAPCSPVDFASPFGVISNTDVDEFVALFFANDPSVAALASPFNIVSNTDVDEFVRLFFLGCPSN